jgi:hypothetical protein
MRVLPKVGLSFTFAIAAANALAQQPTPVQRPSVKLGLAVPINEDPPANPDALERVVRAAPPGGTGRPGVTPLFGNRNTRLQSQPGTPEGGGQPGLQPRTPQGNPMITEQRGPITGQPMIPQGTPTPFVPNYPTQPYGMQPIITTQGPGVMQPGTTIGTPIAGTPIAGAPVPLGGVPAPNCDPLLGGYGTPVAPSAPLYVGDGGVVPAPRLEDPYWGPVNPLFPRVRTALADVLTGNRLTLGAEYLLWFARAQNLPPLLTTSSPQFNGIIGQGDTRILYGDQSATPTTHSGVRVSGLYQFNDRWGIDGNIWYLGRNGANYETNSLENPVIARPFFNVNSGQNFSQLVASPGLATGAAAIVAETSLWGADTNFRLGLLCGQCSRADLQVGFKFLNLSDTLLITEQFQRTADSNTGIGVPEVVSGTVVDRFRTENNFYGVNLGLAGQLERGWWYMQGHANVGLGQVYQSAMLEGSQSLLNSNGTITNSQGGLLVLPGANLGTFRQVRFGAVPDVGLTLGLNLTQRLRFGVGYNLIYINSVIRPSTVIDPGLDVTRIPNFPLDPAPAPIAGLRPSINPLRTTDFFVQGITFSLNWTW